MKKQKLYIGGASGAMVCFDRNIDGIHYGRVYHRYSRKPIEFEGFLDMIEKMEAFYDEIQCPFPATARRKFRSVESIIEVKKKNYWKLYHNQNHNGNHGNQSVRREIMREQIMSDEELLQKRGENATFIVQVQHRQNSTWQGRVTWVETKETVYFRSALELIELIDGAVEQMGKANYDDEKEEA